MEESLVGDSEESEPLLGELDGAADGSKVVGEGERTAGPSVPGKEEGANVGEIWVGVELGSLLLVEGSDVGCNGGATVGSLLGRPKDGAGDGATVGTAVEVLPEGVSDGSMEGDTVGDEVS
jgi:hypothetical protein